MGNVIRHGAHSQGRRVNRHSSKLWSTLSRSSRESSFVKVVQHIVKVVEGIVIRHGRGAHSQGH